MDTGSLDPVIQQRMSHRLEGGHSLEVKSMIFGTKSLDSILVLSLSKQIAVSLTLYVSLSTCVKWGYISPGWYGSVDWVQACEPGGCWFGSRSGHMPGLQARYPVGDAQEATTHWCFSPSLSPSLPLFLKIKPFKKLNKLKNGDILIPTSLRIVIRIIYKISKIMPGLYMNPHTYLYFIYKWLYWQSSELGYSLDGIKLMTIIKLLLIIIYRQK